MWRTVTKSTRNIQFQNVMIFQLHKTIHFIAIHFMYLFSIYIYTDTENKKLTHQVQKNHT